MQQGQYLFNSSLCAGRHLDPAIDWLYILHKSVITGLRIDSPSHGDEHFCFYPWSWCIGERASEDRRRIYCGFVQDRPCLAYVCFALFVKIDI